MKALNHYESSGFGLGHNKYDYVVEHDNTPDRFDEINFTLVTDSGAAALPSTWEANPLFEKQPASVTDDGRTEKQKPVFTTRAASLEDIDAMVEMDMKGFASVYNEYGLSREEMRADLREKFAARLEKIDLDWIRIAEENGEICGFIMSCPTAKPPEAFQSWEETTDNGTLETTYDPEGPYIYVVSLTMPRPDSGDSPKNMLFVDQIGKLIQEGYAAGYFESRLPGLREWMTARAWEEGKDIETLSTPEKNAFAEEYVSSTVERKGRQLPLDPHLRLYKSIGCKLLELVPEAYQDGPSMNYGVVAVYENPLPKKLQRNAVVRNLAGTVIRNAAKSHRLVKKLF